MRHFADEISKYVFSLQAVRLARSICIYVSKQDEVDTANIMQTIWRQKKTVVVPRVEKRDLLLYEIRSFGDLKKGAFGIREPRQSCRLVPSSDVDVFIVPGVAFDRYGHRKGHGYGYYDRLLRNISVPKIGLCFESRLIAQVAVTKYDVPMDMVITENQIIDVTQNKRTKGKMYDKIS